MEPKTSFKFLLGGHDLEMTEIRRILEARGIPFHDNYLGWNNAKLSSYSDVLNDEDRFIGIELISDIAPPKNYLLIDHHNENVGKPSAIEQVAELLGIDLTREQQLIAANDKGFIPAMEAIGATQDEINEIRQRDRKAQGITKADELLGKKSIRKNLTKKDGITVVKSLTSKFATITDRLHPCKQLLIYTDDELNFYGEGTNLLIESFSVLINEKKAYSGGTGEGFFGLTGEGILALGGIKPAQEKVLEILSPETTTMNSNNNQQANDVQELPDNKPLYSYHIFIFPFKWDNKRTKHKSFSERFDLKDVKKRDGSNWINMPNPITPEYATELYNEKNFFYEFVHQVLYDEGDNKEPVILHFERKEAYDPMELIYEIDVIANPCKRYRLNLKSIGLNIYSTGTGSLTFYLENHDYPEFDDILRINQFGRRIFPPFFGDKTGVLETKQKELANHIAILGLSGGEHRFFEDFEGYTEKTDWKPARFIDSLIEDFTNDLKICPVTDDRMHILCWYGNDNKSKLIKGKWLNTEGFKKDWYRFLFVDGGNDPMCKNKKMMDKLIKEHTYLRWTDYGCLHGISRYSFVYLTGSDPGFL